MIFLFAGTDRWQAGQSAINFCGVRRQFNCLIAWLSQPKRGFVRLQLQSSLVALFLLAAQRSRQRESKREEDSAIATVEFYVSICLPPACLPALCVLPALILSLSCLHTFPSSSPSPYSTLSSPSCLSSSAPPCALPAAPLFEPDKMLPLSPPSLAPL